MLTVFALLTTDIAFGQKGELIIGDCFRVRYCGVTTVTDLANPEREPQLLTECLTFTFSVRTGDGVTPSVSGMSLDRFAVGGRVQGFSLGNGLNAAGLAGSHVQFTGMAFRPQDGSADISFMSLEGRATNDMLTFTVSDGIDSAANMHIEFVSTFCDIENFDFCGFCSDAPDGMEPEETFVRWNTAEGAFSVDGNWDPPQVPTQDEVAIFDSPGVSLVTISGAESRRAEVRRGTTHFIGGRYDLVHTSLENRSFTFGQDPSNLSFLFLRGHELRTVHSAIGLAGNLECIVDVEAESGWDIQGRLSVGMGGNGVLIIRPGGVVASGETRIGDLAGGLRNLIIVGETPKNLSAKGPPIPPLEDALFATGNLAVGLEGTGQLTIGDKGKVFGSEQVTIGDRPGATGNVLIQGQSHTAFWELSGDVDVGVEGTGTLTIVEGNSLDIPGNLNVGIGQGGRGTVDITGGSGLTVQGTLSVGIEGTGGLRVNEGMTSASARIGTGTGGEGTVAIDSIPSVWNSGNMEMGKVLRNMLGNVVEVEGKGTLLLIEGLVLAQDITLNMGSRILGSGAVIANSLVGEGTISPGLRPTKDFFPTESSGIEFSEAKQAIEGSRVLALETNVMLDGGTIEISANGSATGDFDQLVVTGDASLNGTVMHFTFTEGYLPVAGDSFSFLTTSGMLTTTNTVLEFEGVAEGFDFQVNELSGTLVFEALNDARVIGQSGVGCGAGAGSRFASTTPVPLILAGIILCIVGRRKTRRVFGEKKRT